MDLALDVGVSPRHLSFVETGRSRPSPELLLTLADNLEVPLRQRNVLLLAAGYAPRYAETSFDATSMERIRANLQRLLDAHEPYPAVVIDRLWNVVLANTAIARLAADLPDDLVEPPMNVFRVCLHPEGLARQTINFAEWAAYLLDQLRLAVALNPDDAMRQLADEVASYPNLPDRSRWSSTTTDEPTLLVPLRLRVGATELSMFTTLTTFGTPQDITLAELAVEMFFPADDASDAVLRAASTT